MGEITAVEENVSVISRFEGGKFKPVRFQWRGRTHRVREVTGCWAAHDGQYKIYHFAVVSDADDYYEMSFHTRDMSWYVDRMMTG